MRNARRGLRWAVFAGCLRLLDPGPVLAAPVDDAARAKARSLGYAGLEAYLGGDYATASTKLEESYQLLPVPSLGLWSARALAKLGRLVAAEARYRAIAGLPINSDDPPVQHSAKVDAAREHAELLPRLPTLSVRIVGASSEAIDVVIDGRRRARAELAVALLVDPGQHRVVGTTDGERSEVVIELRESAHEEVELRFSGTPRAASREPVSAVSAEPVPVRAPVVVSTESPASQALTAAGWVCVGVGASAFATSLVLYRLASNQQEGFQRSDRCQMGGCSQDEVDVYNDLRDAQRLSFIGGAVLGVVGATTLITLWLRGGEADDGIALRLGPSSLVLDGVF